MVLSKRRKLFTMSPYMLEPSACTEDQPRKKRRIEFHDSICPAFQSPTSCKTWDSNSSAFIHGDELNFQESQCISELSPPTTTSDSASEEDKKQSFEHEGNDKDIPFRKTPVVLCNSERRSNEAVSSPKDFLDRPKESASSFGSSLEVMDTMLEESFLRKAKTDTLRRDLMSIQNTIRMSKSRTFDIPASFIEENSGRKQELPVESQDVRTNRASRKTRHSSHQGFSQNRDKNKSEEQCLNVPISDFRRNKQSLTAPDLLGGEKVDEKGFWEDILRDSSEGQMNTTNLSYAPPFQGISVQDIYKTPRMDSEMETSKRVIEWIIKEYGSMRVPPLNAFCPIHKRLSSNALKLVRRKFPELREGRLNEEEVRIVRQNLGKLMRELNLSAENARSLMKELMICGGPSWRTTSRYYLGCFAGQGILDRRFIYQIFEWIAASSSSS